MAVHRSDVFQNIFGRYGGALELDKFNADQRVHLQNLLETHRYWIGKKTGYSENEPHTFPAGDIYVDLVGNNAFNAIAATLYDEDYIGIFLGTNTNIILYSFAVLADPLAFSWIGSAGEEGISSQLLFALRDPISLPTFLNRNPAKLIQNDPVRSDFTDHLTYIVSALLFCHEMGHLIGGHNRFFKDKFGVNELHEFSAVDFSEEECRVKRALELEADCNAIRNAHSIWCRYCEQHRSEMGGVDTTEIFGAAVALLFWIMEGLEVSKGVLQKRRAHPPSLVRLINAMGVAAFEPPPNGLQLDWSRLKRGSLEIRRWGRRNNLPWIVFSNDLGRQWQEVQSDLNLILPSLREYAVKRAKRWR